VQGDIHDIGKNLVSMLLTCYGFMVTDLGVNVPPAEFVARVSEVPPDVVGLSGLLTTSYEAMRETIALLRAEAQLKHLSLPIIIGGGMINDEVCRYVGADHWALDAMTGVRLCQQLTSGR
ncbi:MAG: cobalamin B12-binding domain-containing protein, partial [Chloroflexi bacterium]|nr:cobalamin B12-binding domain-containing protein [Chloroflexota bacterium]